MPNSTPARRFLSQLVRTKSFSGSEQEAAKLCAQRMRELGYLHVKIDEVGNVLGANYDYTKDPHADLLLFSHLDTVDGFWEVKEDSQGISGRGAVDAKGCLASYIEAGAHTPKHLKVVVAGVTKEEALISEGTEHLLTYLKPKLAVNGEPSNCDGITIAYKGRLLVECRTEGEAAHAGMNAENPIERTIEYYEKLRKHFPRHHAFESVIFNVTHIDYGHRDALNVIPGQLDFFIDVRIPPSRDIAEITRLFKSSAPKGITVKVTKSFAGSEMQISHPLVRSMVQAVRSQGSTPRYLKKSGGADMNISMNMGIPTIAYGPGDSKLDHTDKEFLHWKDYEKAIEVLKNLLQNLKN
ncbi:[LysW]-lysine/[LysW]-ornithine hydrolase [Candidatus Anstonella stagnisolia]|nr:[LysW]-lysine/[LysW]-ornithine hydrolase [Candidatus Anstonella stagnisolia]